MGASGCGQKHADERDCRAVATEQGEVLLNGQSLYRDLDASSDYVSYIPQETRSTSTSRSGRICSLRRRFARRISRDATASRRFDGKLVELGLSVNGAMRSSAAP